MQPAPADWDRPTATFNWLMIWIRSMLWTSIHLAEVMDTIRLTEDMDSIHLPEDMNWIHLAGDMDSIEAVKT
jgi:hypothetical protein